MISMIEETFDAHVPMRQFRCPNGLRVWNAPASRAETRFIFREIFERRCYEQHGVTVEDGDVIVDVGANVGMFALSLIERFRNVRIVCVEPVPNTRACLVRNLMESPWRKDHAIAILDSALGSTNGEATISYFPRVPGNSTLHLEDKRREWRSMVDAVTLRRTWKVNKLLALLLLPVYPWRRRLFTRFVGPVLTVPCAVRTLSETIRQQGLERVDLLKIDVEGAELDVLKGIEEQHWPRIRQLAMEIAPAHKGELTALADRLRSLGFTNVTVESMPGGTAAPNDPAPCTVYAVRVSPHTAGPRSTAADE
jgi:FkbM family methyltransferase